MVEMNNKKREAQSTKDEKYKVYFAFDNDGESFESIMEKVIINRLISDIKK